MAEGGAVRCLDGLGRDPDPLPSLVGELGEIGGSSDAMATVPLDAGEWANDRHSGSGLGECDYGLPEVHWCRSSSEVRH